MDKKIILVCALLLLTLSFVSCLHQPFTKGNLLALKKNVNSISENIRCAAGGFVEFTPAGQIVQEVLLPTYSTDEHQACLLFSGDYNSRHTIATDGLRVIIPCCNVNEDPTIPTLVSFAIVHGDGRFETTPILNNTINHRPVNSVMDGDDIWYSYGDFLFYAPATSTVTTQIFTGSVFALQIHEGNLFTSNFDTFPGSLAQVGTGLPKELTTDRVDLLEHNDVNSFLFLGELVVLSLYPEGLKIYNVTSGELVLGSSGTREIVQFVPLFEQNKVIAHVAGFDGRTPAIYSFPWSETNNIGTLDTATILLKTTADGFYYYSPTFVPINSCEDGKKNNDETDVDCGGSFCSQRCDGGKQCLTDNDCVSSGCTNNVCDVAEPDASTSPSNRPQATFTSSASLFAAYLASITLISFVLVDSGGPSCNQNSRMRSKPCNSSKT